MQFQYFSPSCNGKGYLYLLKIKEGKKKEKLRQTFTYANVYLFLSNTKVDELKHRVISYIFCRLKAVHFNKMQSLLIYCKKINVRII